MKKGLALLLTLVLLLSAVISAPAENALPTKWDLASVYAGTDEWMADYDTVLKLLDDHEQYRGKLNNAQDILDYLRFSKYSELTRLQSKLQLYADLGACLNSTDPVFAQLDSLLSVMKVKESRVSAFAEPEIYALPMEERERIFSDPIFADYAYQVRKYTDPRSQPLGEEGNSTKAILTMALGYPKKVYDRMIYVEMPYPTITMPDGTVRELTDSVYADIVYSDEYSRDFRAEANRLYLSRVTNYINTLASLLEGTAKEAYAKALLEHFDSTLESELYKYDVNPAVYNMLIASAHEGIPDFQRYYRAHARGLGLEEQYPFDLATCVSDFNPGRIEYEDAVAEVTEALGVLGEDYIKTFRTILSSGHADVYPTDAKTTGAMEMHYSSEYLPWVLFNYTGYSEDVSTIAHEMGHAMYDTLTMENQPVQYHNPTVFTQEVASTTNELLYYHYKISHAADDDEKLFYLQNILDLFASTFFAQAYYAEFEDYFYKTVEAGGALDGEELSDKFQELQNTYRGDTVVSFPDSRYHWAAITHFYEYVYYVYQYASSICYAASIAQGILSGKENAVEDYLSFLKAGRSADPQTLLSIAGVDPLDAETYRTALDYFRELVDEYELLIDAKLKKE